MAAGPPVMEIHKGVGGASLGYFDKKAKKLLKYVHPLVKKRYLPFEGIFSSRRFKEKSG
jgi:hypothetical protein